MNDLFGEEIPVAEVDEKSEVKNAKGETTSGPKTDDEKKEKPKRTRRVIKGNLTYSTTPGKTRDVLNAIIPAERPDKFSQNFLNDTLHQTGGSANQQIGVLKSLGFLDSGGCQRLSMSCFNKAALEAPQLSKR